MSDQTLRPLENGRPARIAPPTDATLALFLGGAALLAALLWIVSRVFLGLDFTDEMQYYGEITSLVDSGKFFQVDLFVQQLGYIFLLPLFRLHALVWPDQTGLILFGRLIMLGGFALVGIFFWRTTRALGEFSRGERLLGLAALSASAPFQIFAPSYNSMAFLLMVTAFTLRLSPRAGASRAGGLAMAAVLTALTYVYPTAGLVLIGMTAIDAARRFGRRVAARLVVFTALGGALVLAFIVVVHGPDFFSDLGVALRFSRAFGFAYILGEPGQLAALAAILAISAGFLLRWRDRANATVNGHDAPSTGRLVRCGGIALVAIAAVFGWLVGVVDRGGFVWTAFFFLLLMLLDSALPNSRREARLAPPVRLARAVLFGCGAVVLALSVSRFPPAYFATAAFLFLLFVVVLVWAMASTEALRDCVVAGTILGAIFALTSGTRLNSFGLAAGAAVPFLVLFAARQLNRAVGDARSGLAGALAMTGVIGAILSNNALHPYRDEGDARHLHRAQNVPAFAGIAMSSTKVDAIRAVRALVGSDSLAGKTVFVAGPHPWIYFVTRGRPATPMFFLHFTGPPPVYDFIAARLARSGQPDAVFVTNSLPPAMAAQLMAWTKQGNDARVFHVPARLLADYQSQMLVDLGSDLMLFRRQPSPP